VKVFFIQDTLAYGGAEKSLLNILPYFSTDISFAVVYLYPKHDLIEEYRSASIPLIFLGLERKYDFWKGYKSLSELFITQKPDLVVSCLLRANLLSRIVCKRLEIPLIGTIVSDSYNEVLLKSKSFVQLQKFKFFWRLDRLTAGIPKVYISNSKCITSSHKETLGISKEKTRVVYRGRPVPERSWKQPPSATYTFISFGRLLVTKGFEELIQAFSCVHKDSPNSRLLIYGEGRHRQPLEKLIAALGLCEAVKLPGVHPHVTEELFSADCFVFPSWYEGFSGALIEAMMSGIPIIASDIPMNLEAVTADGNALVFPVRNVQALEGQMRYAMDNPAQMAILGKNAREEAIRRFDIKTIAKQYEGVLRAAFQNYCNT
jgi:glycosyltransferase involved in cell wall biosynthesis